MFQEIGGTEILLIAIVALIVVGPKDLPVLLRKLGQFTAKLRGMASEFRSSFDEMARQSELDELRREVAAMRQGAHVDATGGANADVHRAFEDIQQGLNSPDPYTYAEPTPVEAAPAPAPRKPRARKINVEAADGAAPAKRAPAKRKPKPNVE
jgi:sec-independent protein translocase protein TatB